MDEQGIQQVRNLFFVRKFQCTLIWNPDTFQVHRTNLDNMAKFLAFQDTVSATSGHACNVQQLRSIDHMVVFASSHTDALCLYLIAQTTFILPESRRHTRLGTRRLQLTSGIVNKTLHRGARGVAISWSCYRRICHSRQWQ